MSENKNKHPAHQILREFGSITPEEYIDERLNHFREWYDKEASKAKRLYQWMKATAVIGGAIVPVLINLPYQYVDLIATVISLIVVILVSLENVFHYRERWKNYRATGQLLSKEYFNFVSADGPYHDLEQKEAFLHFVDRVEGTIESENVSTLNIMTTLSNKPKS
jgi:hypothetical protein